MLLPTATVINLPHRTDRRRDTEAMLARGGFPGARYFPAIRPDSPGPFGSIGERGAFLSHQAVLGSAHDSSVVWVMEDDVEFRVTYAEFERAFHSLPSDWDVFYAGHMQLPDRVVTMAQTGIVPIPGEVEFIGVHCYLLTEGAVRVLLSELEVMLSRPRGHPDGGPMPIDGALNETRRKRGLVTYAAIPPLAYQRPSRTDIGPNKWFDRLPVVRDGAKLLRRVLHTARSLS